MRLSYDSKGNCTRCGLPGSGFVADGVCECGDRPRRYVRPAPNTPSRNPRVASYRLLMAQLEAHQIAA